MIDTPGIYTLSMDDYLADPCPEPSFSTSVAHALLTKTPQHAWLQHPRLNPNLQRDESTAMDIGTAAHDILLEGSMDKIVIVEAPDWRTNKAKEARDTARLQGKTPILEHKMREIMAMVRAAQDQIANSELASAFRDGQPEQTLIWQEGVTWCKSRPDWLTAPTPQNKRVILDYKTTAGSAEPNAFMRGNLLGMGYDLQAMLGVSGLEQLTGASVQFVFMVQEVEEPYAMSFVGLSPAFLDVAQRKLNRALELWRDCLLTNAWPGYPSRVAWVDPPAWVQMEEGMTT